MTRVETGTVARNPWASREKCANGHPWTPESTRWRIRHDKGETAPSRDCLVCKRVSEADRRRRKKISERHYS